MRDCANHSSITYLGKADVLTCVKIVKEFLLLSTESIFDSFNKNSMFIPNNVFSHRSKCTMKCCKDEGLKSYEMIITSSDYYSIENFWNDINKKLRKMKPTCVTHLLMNHTEYMVMLYNMLKME